MDYEDFTVQLGPETASGMQVKASRSSGGEATGRFQPPVQLENLISWLPAAVRRGMGPAEGWVHRDLTRLSGPTPSPPNAEEIGHTIFESLFTGAVRSLLDRSLGSVEQAGSQGLRIKLKLDLTDASQALLHSVPWELLYRSDAGHFLGLSRLSPIVRYLDVATPIVQQPLPTGLRILVLAPDPEGLESLDLATERANLRTLQREVSGLEVEFLEPATLAQLRRALSEKEFHALHFMGHGSFDPTRGEGSIFLEDSGGAATAVSAAALTEKLRDFRSIRLVVLNGCSTARAGSGAGLNSFSGIAPALMRAGVPAVLAMQLPITDRAAIHFSEAFYRRLCAGDPVDAAVSEGRQAIHSDDPLSLEWAIPALFMRVADGAIFRAKRRSPTSARGGDAERELEELPSGVDHLRARNYEQAIVALRQAFAREPRNGLAAATLGIALGRGRHLSSLPYEAAVEMHRLFSTSLSRPGGRWLPAAALVALKVDYFRRNSVREPAPSLEEALGVAARLPATPEEIELLCHLEMTDRAQEVIASINRPMKGRRTS